LMTFFITISLFISPLLRWYFIISDIDIAITPLLACYMPLRHAALLLMRLLHW
jgi:hypothetical protein